MEPEDPRLKERMKALAETISQAFSENPEIRRAIREIAEGGYHVDIILASVARVSKIKDPPVTLTPEFSAYDKSFLHAIKIKLAHEDEDNDIHDTERPSEN